MGDRCYVSLTLRKVDAPRFEGLVDEEEWQDDDHPHLVQLGASECNYGYCCLTDDPDMPTDVPYYGHSGAGDSYGAGEFACDGQGTYMHVGSDEYGCYPVRFDEETGLADSDSIARIGVFIKFRNAVRKHLEEIPDLTPAKE